GGSGGASPGGSGGPARGRAGGPSAAGSHGAAAGGAGGGAAGRPGGGAARASGGRAARGSGGGAGARARGRAAVSAGGGPYPKAAETCGGERDFGARESDRVEREDASRGTKGGDPGNPLPRGNNEGQRVSGAGACDSGVGSASGGDIDPDIIGVGADGSGIAS